MQEVERYGVVNMIAWCYVGVFYAGTAHERAYFILGSVDGVLYPCRFFVAKPGSKNILRCI